MGGVDGGRRRRRKVAPALAVEDLGVVVVQHGGRGGEGGRDGLQAGDADGRELGHVHLVVYVGGWVGGGDGGRTRDVP